MNYPHVELLVALSSAAWAAMENVVHKYITFATEFVFALRTRVSAVGTHAVSGRGGMRGCAEWSCASMAR